MACTEFRPEGVSFRGWIRRGTKVFLVRSGTQKWPISFIRLLYTIIVYEKKFSHKDYTYILIKLYIIPVRVRALGFI